MWPLRIEAHRETGCVTACHPLAEEASGNQTAAPLSPLNAAKAAVSEVDTSASPVSPTGTDFSGLLSFKRRRTTAEIHGTVKEVTVFSWISGEECCASGSTASVHGAPAARPDIHHSDASSVPAV